MPENIAEIEQLSNKIERLSIQIEKQQLSQLQKPSEKKTPWWITVTQILGIPALVIVMILNFTQSSKTIEDTQKSAAETEKIKTEEIKTRVEIQKLLNELSDQKTANIEEYRDQIDKTLPKLKETIEKLAMLKSHERSKNLNFLILTFFLLWIVFQGLHLIFNIIEYIWNGIVGSFASAVFSLTGRESRFRRRFVKTVQITVPLLYPLAGILRWAIELSIFVALVIPFWDNISSTFGSDITAQAVINSVFDLNISEAVSQLQQIIKSGSSS